MKHKNKQKHKNDKKQKQNTSDINTNTSNSIFISQKEINKINDISGKITYTNVLETIPDDSYEERLNDWRKKYKMEWRWRFLEFPNGRLTAEISALAFDEDQRLYFNRHGQWVKRVVDPIYDSYVKKEYYYYST